MFLGRSMSSPAERARHYSPGVCGAYTTCLFWIVCHLGNLARNALPICEGEAMWRDLPRGQQRKVLSMYRGDRNSGAPVQQLCTGKPQR